MASLFKRRLRTGIGWRIDYRLDGKYRSEYLPVGTPLPTARTILAEFDRRLLDAKLNGTKFISPLKEGTTPGPAVPFSVFMEKYLEFSRATKAEKTFMMDRGALRNFKLLHGENSVGSVTYDICQEYVIRRLRKVKETSVNVDIRHLKSIFSQAVKWEYIGSNPWDGVKQVKSTHKDFPKFLSMDEVAKLLDAIPDGRLRALVAFYLYTGARRDEALNLAWEDIDLARGAVVFRKTKTGAARSVPLNHEIVSILKALDRAGQPFPYKGDHVTHAVKRYMAAAGLDPALHLHSLRHTFASHHVMAGTDLSTVARLLGHTSTKTTEIYAHLAPDHLKAAAARLRF